MEPKKSLLLLIILQLFIICDKTKEKKKMIQFSKLLISAYTSIICFQMFNTALIAKQIEICNMVKDNAPTAMELVVTESGDCYFYTEFPQAYIKTYFKSVPKFSKGLQVCLENKPYKQVFILRDSARTTFTSDRLYFTKSSEGWSNYRFEYDVDFEYHPADDLGKKIHVMTISVVINETQDHTNEVIYSFWPLRIDKE